MRQPQKRNHGDELVLVEAMVDRSSRPSRAPSDAASGAPGRAPSEAASGAPGRAPSEASGAPQRAPAAPAQPAAGVTPFAALGGSEELIVRLVRSFYGHMALHEKELAAVHELEPTGQISERTQERFGRFLIEWLGGPARYSPQEGHPRLRMRHGRVPIDTKMADAWVRSMQHALDAEGVQGEVRAFLDARFLEVAYFLRNRAG